MKKTVTTFFVTLIFLMAYGQSSILKLYAQDAVGNTDTLIFGHQEGSTIGIDAQLGETNLYSTSLSGLDIRIRQRDSSNVSCGQIASLDETIYWPQNIESKVDFRPYTGLEGYANNTFEVYIYCDNYPVNITVDNSEIGFLDNKVLLTGKNINCAEYFVLGTLTSEENFFTDETDAITPILFFSFESYDENYYIVGADHQTGSGETFINVFPNPATDFIHIHSRVEGNVCIYQSTGEKVFEKKISPGNSDLRISHLEKGIYYLYFWNNKQTLFNTIPFIKK
jgi:hypothetical protein